MSEEARGPWSLSRRQFGETLLRAAGLLAFPVAGCADLGPIPAAAATQQPEFDVIVLSNVMVAMRTAIRRMVLPQVLPPSYSTGDSRLLPQLPDSAT